MATLATITATDRDGNIIGKFPQPPYFLLDYNDIPVLLNEPFKDDTEDGRELKGKIKHFTLREN